MLKLSAAVLAIVTLGACSTIGKPPQAPIAAALLAVADGRAIGTASLGQAGSELELTVRVAGMQPGSTHGIHLHAIGRCEGPAFASAGGHLNPDARQHGLENPAGSHLGDLPNLRVNAAGTGSLVLPIAGAAEFTRSKLFDADGTAIVIHAEPDDLRTDPSGNSGARIACGVLVPASR